MVRGQTTGLDMVPLPGVLVERLRDRSSRVAEPFSGRPELGQPTLSVE
jgi:hypothetical protein